MILLYNTSKYFKLKIIILIFSFFMFGIVELLARQRKELDMFQCVKIASDSSLQAFMAENYYQSGYWEYQSYKATRLPSLSLRLTPVQYNRNITKRYDFQENIDIYRTQQSLYSSGGLRLDQNVSLTGGSFFMDSELGYIKNYGENDNVQFSTVPIRIGYSQALFGFNSFRWNKKIEPLKFEKAKSQFLYRQQEVAENTVQHFFNFALAQKEHELAIENLLSADTLYNVGIERQKISAISNADVLTLKMDMINAQNTLKNTELNLKDKQFAFITFLNIGNDCDYSVRLPEIITKIFIPIDDALLYAKNNNPDYLSYRQEVLEAEREVDKNKKRSVFDANISASVGFNQAAEEIATAYKNPLQQDIFTLTFSIPILDWGIRKGQHNMSKSNLSLINLSIQQKKRNLEQEIKSTIDNFNVQQEMIFSAQEVLSLSGKAYQINKERFIVGKLDINSLTFSLNRYKEAQRNYLSSLKYYWLNYFKIKKLTLYDFEEQKDLSTQFDNKLNISRR